MKKTLLIALVATACISVNKSVLMDRSAQPLAKDEVFVFLPEDEIPDSCERVAILNASGDEDFANEAKIIDKLREETGKLGGNALLLRTMEDPGTGEKIASVVFGTSADRDASAIALWCPDL